VAGFVMDRFTSGRVFQAAVKFLVGRLIFHGGNPLNEQLGYADRSRPKRFIDNAGH